MNTNIYRIDKSLGKYCTFRLNDISHTDICGIVNNFGINQYYDGLFEASIYRDGKLSDIELNGWTFSSHFKGRYHEPGSFCETSFEIECIDPNHNELKIYSTPHDIYFSEEKVLIKYLEMINIYSYFENADIALKFNYLSRSIEEGNCGGRGRTVMRITYGDILDMIIFFKNFYRNLGEDNDSLFLNEIKETVNGAIDGLKKIVNLDKIE